MSAADQLKKMVYENTYRENKNSSIKEIQNKMLRVSRLIIDYGARTDSESLARLTSLSAEADAYSDLLKEKREEAQKKEDDKKRHKEAVITWKNNLELLRTTYRRKLKYSSHLEGQLIVSILLENYPEALSADEIRSWFDELLMLDDDLYIELLTKLVEENVITEIEGNYKFFRMCDETLVTILPETKLELLSNFHKGSIDRTIAESIIDILDTTGEPWTSDELYREIAQKTDFNEHYFKDKFGQTIYKLCHDLDILSYAKSDPTRGHDPYLGYYIKMLGENKNEM